MRELFHRFAHAASIAAGTPWVFIAAIVFIAGWAMTGPAFGYSDTWQLVVNTSTTIVTFLMVFLIQNTQNRDAQAMHLKLDELLRAVANARTGLVELEKMSDAELDKLGEEFAKLRAEAKETEGAERELPSAGQVKQVKTLIAKKRRRRKK